MTVLTVGLLSEEPEGSHDADSLDTEAPGLLSVSVIARRRRAFFIPATVSNTRGHNYVATSCLNSIPAV